MNFISVLSRAIKLQSSNRVDRADSGNYVIGPPGETRIHWQQAPLVMGRSQVTVGQYRSFLRAEELGEAVLHPVCTDRSLVQPLFDRLRNASYYQSEQFLDYPATCVSWWGAWAYAEWVGARLPTSTEWEVAARGQDGRLFPWGEDPDMSSANCADHWARRLLPTWDEWKRAHDRGELREGYPTLPGSFPRNLSPSGCLDMAGNVWEWTATVLENGTDAVIAGGSYDNPIRAVRCSSRGVYRLSGRSNAVGFRIVEG